MSKLAVELWREMKTADLVPDQAAGCLPKIFEA